MHGPAESRVRVTTYEDWMDNSQLKTRELNEVFLLHGTKPDVVEKIVERGFDERVGNLNGLFGAGIYFAENSSKSNQYVASRPRDDRFYMFLARVRLGTPQHVQGTCQRRRRPDERPGTSGKKIYDSLIGNSDHREFIVYDRTQTYPEFLIEYKTVKKGGEDIFGEDADSNHDDGSSGEDWDVQVDQSQDGKGRVETPVTPSSPAPAAESGPTRLSSDADADPGATAITAVLASRGDPEDDERESPSFQAILDEHLPDRTAQLAVCKWSLDELLLNNKDDDLEGKASSSLSSSSSAAVVSDADLAECVHAHLATNVLLRDRLRHLNVVGLDVAELLKRGRQALVTYYAEIERLCSPFLPPQESERRRAHCREMLDGCNDDNAHVVAVEAFGQIEDALRLLCVRNGIRDKGVHLGMGAYISRLGKARRITPALQDQLERAASFRNAHTHDSVGAWQGAEVKLAKARE
eukprot:g6326.t1